MEESVYKKREATKKEKQVRTAVAKLMRKLRKLEEPIRERMARERSERAAKLKGTPPPEKTPDQHIREFAAEIVKAKPATPVADAFNVARKVIEANGVGLPPKAQPQPKPLDVPEYLHPFKILVFDDGGGKRMTVNYGAGFTLKLVSSGGTFNYQAVEMAMYYSEGGDLANDPFPVFGSQGSDALTTSTTYGIWLVADGTGGGATDAPSGAGYEFRTIQSMGWTTALIVRSTTHTTPADSIAFAASRLVNNSAVAFIGQITLNPDGTSTIKQYRKSDITFPSVNYSHGFVSAETNNDLVAAGSGNPGLFVQVVDRTDGNDVLQGVNNSAFLSLP
jgi:hypothetical protein